MKRSPFITVLVCLCFAAPAGGNLCRNGGFERSRTRWFGDLDIGTEEGNKFGELELEKNKTVSFHQKMKLEESKQLTVRFRIRKSSDYEGSDVFNIRLYDERSHTVAQRNVPDNDEWNTIEVTFYNLRIADRVKVFFVAGKGTGSLFFDDIEIEETNKKLSHRPAPADWTPLGF